MDELNSGSHADSADLSKTFDNDETFDKVEHRCLMQDGTIAPGVRMLSLGSHCDKCGRTVHKQKQL